LFAAGCARTVPPRSAPAALYRDLERMVTVAETAGWYIDRQELENLLPDALDSVCRVPETDRRDVLAWVDALIAARGGPVEDAWRKRGKRLEEVADLLTLTRIRMTLAHAMSAATADCPFWLEPSAAFRGRQISDDRWLLNLGGGGKGILVRQDGETDLSFGGAGRLLLGRSLGDRSTLLTGFELGGNGSFPRGEDGSRGNLVLGIDVVVLLVYRHTFVNSFLELDGGWLGALTEQDWDDVDHGVHLGISFGARVIRVRWFFPGAALGLSYERIGAADGDAPLTLIKLGVRGSFDIDL
jgi:hypothetical protein